MADHNFHNMELDNIFGPEGTLSKHFTGYEQRPGQLRMARLVAKALSSSQSVAVEGSTGVGKTFAYLVPLILSGRRAIISTSNKSLQDQLSNKDLPALKGILTKDFNWTVLKGKNNYFCHEHFKMNQGTIREELGNEEIARLMQWVDETDSGDLEYYPGELSPKVKEMVACNYNTAHGKGSPFYALCFAVRAREAAQDAQIILVNHTLLALDTSIRDKTDGKAGFLPSTEVVIIDEAHTFEKFSSMAFSNEVSIYSLLHFLNWYVVKESIPGDYYSKLVQDFGEAIGKYLPEKNEQGYYEQSKASRFRFPSSVTNQLEYVIERVEDNVSLQEEDTIRAKVEEVAKEGKNLLDKLHELAADDPDMLRWSEARDGRGGKPVIKLKSVPINVAEMLRENLFKDKVVICTSATLSVNGNFGFFRGQIGLPEEALELAVKSPFDYKKNALVYVSSGEEEKWVEIERLLTYSQGRAFILFTSYRAMGEVYERVDVPYPKLVQSKGVSRMQLLEEFREIPNAVLFGTRSFWEGVDVRGDDLVLVIIDKIPFETPTDLLYSSKIERIDQEYGEGQHWIRYTVPDACLKVKQGAGRLVRSKTDIGVVALLDARINYRNYGKAILRSLPPARVTQNLEDVKDFFENRLEEVR